MSTKTQNYNWNDVKERILKGVSYAATSPFNYRFQLRLKISPSYLAYSFWDMDKCSFSGCIQSVEIAAWEELFAVLAKNKVLDIPCVSVGISIWNEMQMLVRPEANTDAPLDIINKALRDQPDKVRKDLQVNGLYAFTALACDTSKMFIFGLPIGYVTKGAIAKFPKDWAKVVWYGPTAIPTQQLKNLESEASFHTVLLKNSAVSLIVQNGKLKFMQQDKMLNETQAIAQGSISRIKSVYSYFNPGELRHFLYPIEVSTAWAATLKACIQGLNVASRIDIVPGLTYKLAGTPDELFIQDMFPTGLPWQ